MSNTENPNPESIGQSAGASRKLSRRSVRIAIAVVALLIIGGGSFAIASTVTSSGPSASSSSSTTTTPGAPGFSRGAINGAVRPGVSGEVTSIQPNSFVVKTRAGTSETVKVSAATKYVDAGVTDPGYSDIKSGDLVSVTGTSSGQTITATQIILGSAGRGGGGRFGNFDIGTVKSVSTNSFVVTTRTGSTQTVNVTSSTKFTDRSVTNPTIQDVKIGDRVLINGTTSGSTVTASTIAILPAGGFGGEGGGRGGFGGGFGGSSGSTGPGSAAPSSN